MQIKWGVTRLVFITKKWAFKIPQLKFGWEFFLRGLLANMQEVEFNKMHDKRMCPIKFYLPGGFLVVMPYCPPITKKDFNKNILDKFYPNNKEDYHPNNICEHRYFNVPVEYKQDSFGYYNNNIVAIDYGS